MDVSAGVEATAGDSDEGWSAALTIGSLAGFVTGAGAGESAAEGCVGSILRTCTGLGSSPSILGVGSISGARRAIRLAAGGLENRRASEGLGGSAAGGVATSATGFSGGI